MVHRGAFWGPHQILNIGIEFGLHAFGLGQKGKIDIGQGIAALVPNTVPHPFGLVDLGEHDLTAREQSILALPVPLDVHHIEFLVEGVKDSGQKSVEASVIDKGRFRFHGLWIKRVTWIYSNQIYGLNPKNGNNPKIFLETFLILYIWRNMLGLSGGRLARRGFPYCAVQGTIKDMELDICVKRFIDVRRELGYTQAEFAQLLGVRNTTADIERGRTKLSGKVVSELLKQFKINPMWLFGESDQKHLDT